jgi:hypothetical protein
MKFAFIGATTKVGSLSHWERVGVRGYGLTIHLYPLTRIALARDCAAERSDLSPWER